MKKDNKYPAKYHYDILIELQEAIIMIFILIAIALGVYFIAIRPISIKMNEEANLHLKNEILQHISDNQATIPVENIDKANDYCNRIKRFQKEGITNIERCSVIDNNEDESKIVIVYFKKVRMSKCVLFYLRVFIFFNSIPGSFLLSYLFARTFTLPHLFFTNEYT